jgi:hypothetical protein
MAKLSAHGRTEIGTLYSLRSAKRYMSDGTVLKNHGFGWKVHGKLKPGIAPIEAFESAKRKQSETLLARPMFAAYRAELHAMTGMCNRWKLHAAVELMPDDCDGVWSEACDGYGDNVHADVDEIRKLCQLYKSALKESQEAKVLQEA